MGAFALVTGEFLPVGVLNDVASDLGITAGRAGLMVTLTRHHGCPGRALAVGRHRHHGPYVAPFFKESAGFDGPTIGSLLLIYGVTGVIGNVFAGFAANRSVRHTLLLVALMIGISTALFPYFATSMTGAAMLIGLWGFAFGAFAACASIWMFVVAPKDVERGMPCSSPCSR